MCSSPSVKRSVVSFAFDSTTVPVQGSNDGFLSCRSLSFFKKNIMDVCPDANTPWEGGPLVDKPAVAAVASCCCVVMNLCYQVSHGPFCVASSTALLKLVMLLKNHISAAIRDKYEEAARWLLYTYPSYIFSLSAGHMGSCSSTSLFFCSSTGGLEFANFDNRSAVLHRVS